jgi:hypothetical protein
MVVVGVVMMMMVVIMIMARNVIQNVHYCDKDSLPGKRN